MKCAGYDINLDGKTVESCSNEAAKRVSLGNAHIHIFLCAHHEHQLAMTIQEMINGTIPAPIDRDALVHEMMEWHYSAYDIVE